MNDCAVLVLYYNKINLTEHCVKSVLNAGYEAERVYCFDNGSRPETFAGVNARFPRLNHRRAEQNGGYSAGFNRGLQWVFDAGYSSALFLTNDTALYPRCIEACLDAARETGAGVIAPRIVFRSTAGTQAEAIDSIGGWFDPLKCALNHWRELRLPQRLDPARDYIPGTALWISAETFRQLGGADETFHMYWEDVDLCFRAHQQGIPLARSYDARVAHGVGQTCRKKPLYTTFYFQRNRIRFCRRYLEDAAWERARNLLENELTAMERTWTANHDAKRLNYLQQLRAELNA